MSEPVLDIRHSGKQLLHVPDDPPQVFQEGIEKPVLTVPQSHPNVGLMPALFAKFRP